MNISSSKVLFEHAEAWHGYKRDDYSREAEIIAHSLTRLVRAGENISRAGLTTAGTYSVDPEYMRELRTCLAAVKGEPT